MKYTSILLKILVITYFSFYTYNNVLWYVSFTSKMNIFQNYLKNQKLKIGQVCSYYDFCKSKRINKVLIETENLIKNLETIKTLDIKGEKEEIIIKVVSDKIESLSFHTKKYIHKEVEKYEQSLKLKKTYYNSISLKIEMSIGNIVNKVYNKKLKNYNKTPKQKKILSSLIKLEKSQKKLLQFQKITFKTNTSMKKNLATILQELKSNLIELKRNLNRDL